jgi:hypothetical protein
MLGVAHPKLASGLGLPIANEDARLLGATSKASVCLQMRPGQIAREIESDNVWRWFHLEVPSVVRDGQQTAPITVFSVTFDVPVDNKYSLAKSDKDGVRFQVFDQSARSAIVVAYGNLGDSVVEIVFSSTSI